jgi:hypothetical protein
MTFSKSQTMMTMINDIYLLFVINKFLLSLAALSPVVWPCMSIVTSLGQKNLNIFYFIDLFYGYLSCSISMN